MMKVPSSDKLITADEVAKHQKVVEEAIFLYHTAANPDFQTSFASYSEDDIREERNARLAEAGEASAMMMLAAIEARFRVDYLRRCSDRQKDPLSRELRQLHKVKGKRVLLLDDLLDIWKRHGTMNRQLAGDIRSAFNYRNWLAHGRYYTPKLGHNYDFESVYFLAQQVEAVVCSPVRRSDE